MTPLLVLPCWLRIRPYKGMSVNALYPDIELDIIALDNETARRKTTPGRGKPRIHQR